MSEPVVMLRDKHGPWAGIVRPYAKSAAGNAIASGFAERVEEEPTVPEAEVGPDAAPANESVEDEMSDPGPEVGSEAAPPEVEAPAGPVEVTLPFNPADIAVKDLAKKLKKVKDVAVVHELQKVDTRTTAAAHYERRVTELNRPRRRMPFFGGRTE